jgi:hypothetical protein
MTVSRLARPKCLCSNPNFAHLIAHGENGRDVPGFVRCRYGHRQLRVSVYDTEIYPPTGHRPALCISHQDGQRQWKLHAGLNFLGVS